MIAWKTKGTQLYQQLPSDCHDSLSEVEPLKEVPENLKKQESFYETLREFMKGVFPVISGIELTNIS